MLRSLLHTGLLAAAAAAVAMSNELLNASHERHHQRETFYVGGAYEKDALGNHTFQGQMYVERLLPEPHAARKPYPLVLMHGATRTGNDWLAKPDGGPGWASFFLAQGYEVYLVDLPFRGRSPWYPGRGEMVAYSAETYERQFTATRDHDLWPTAKYHTQWPGPGTIGDPVFDAFYASAVQMLGNDMATHERAAQAACAALLDRIGRPAVLVAHSQGGSVPYLAADARPALVHLVVNLEPVGPPFVFAAAAPRADGEKPLYGVATVPLAYEPPVRDPDRDFVKQVVKPSAPGLADCVLQAETPPPRRLKNLANSPVLVVTAHASYHARYDWCTVAFLKQAGVAVEHLELEARGILGNGHMMYMEKNSDVIAAEVEKWIADKVSLGGGV